MNIKFKIPKLGTKALEEYFYSWVQINQFFYFVLSLVGRIEKVAKNAHEVLFDTAHSEEEKQKLLEDWEERKSPVDELKNHRQFFLEVILVRHVENYLNYLSGLIYEIFIQRPETLKSSGQIEVSDVLSHSDMSELVRSIAESRVEKLSYRSFQDLQDYFKDHFGLDICYSDSFSLIVEAIEVRNISVHNRCIMNERYIKRTGENPDAIGKLKELYVTFLDDFIPILAKNVNDLDKISRKKLNLEGGSFQKNGRRKGTSQ